VKSFTLRAFATAFAASQRPQLIDLAIEVREQERGVKSLALPAATVFRCLSDV